MKAQNQVVRSLEDKERILQNSLAIIEKEQRWRVSFLCWVVGEGKPFKVYWLADYTEENKGDGFVQYWSVITTEGQSSEKSINVLEYNQVHIESWLCDGI